MHVCGCVCAGPCINNNMRVRLRGRNHVAGGQIKKAGCFFKDLSGVRHLPGDFLKVIPEITIFENLFGGFSFDNFSGALFRKRFRKLFRKILSTTLPELCDFKNRPADEINSDVQMRLYVWPTSKNEINVNE